MGCHPESTQQAGEMDQQETPQVPQRKVLVLSLRRKTSMQQYGPSWNWQLECNWEEKRPGSSNRHHVEHDTVTNADSKDGQEHPRLHSDDCWKHIQGGDYSCYHWWDHFWTTVLRSELTRYGHVRERQRAQMGLLSHENSLRDFLSLRADSWGEFWHCINMSWVIAK